MDYFQKAVAIWNTTSDDAQLSLADAHDKLGYIYRHRGNYDSALSHCQKALEINKALLGKNHPKVAKSYNLIGIVHKENGAYHLALEYYRTALTIWEEAFGKQYRGVAGSYNNIGNVQFELKNYQAAINSHEEALTIREEIFSKDHPSVAFSYQNIGNVYHGMADYSTALQYYQKSLTIYQKTLGKEHAVIADAYFNIGNTYNNMKLYDTALEYHYKALAIEKNSKGQRHPYIADVLTAISEDYEGKGQYHKGLYFCQRGLIANTVSFNDTALQANPAVGDYLDANLLLNTLEVKANLLDKLYLERRNDSLKLAFDTYHRIDSIIDDVQHSYHTFSDKLFLSNLAKKLYSRGIRICYTLYNMSNEEDYLRYAFMFAEKSKARVLTESMENFRAKKTAGIPDTLLAVEKALKVDQSFYRSEIQNAKVQQSPYDTERIQAYTEQLFSTNRKYDSLIAELERLYPRYYQLKYNNNTLAFSEIQAKLPENTALLEYVVGDSSLYIFSVTRNELQALSLVYDSTLRKSIEHLRSTLTPQSLEKPSFEEYQIYTKEAYKLYLQLVFPAVSSHFKKASDIKKLIIIPDETIGYLPFELLLTEEDKSNSALNYRMLPYLIKDYVLSYGYSAKWSLSFSLVNQYPSKKFGRYLAFAPEYETSLTDTKQHDTYSASRSQVMPLYWNRIEAQNISKHLDGITLVGESATEHQFKKIAAQYSVVHLAMHALIDNDNPMYSRLVFTQGTDTTEDNYLNAHELYNMELPARLAVLSACNTGFGQLQKGEGIMSLAHAFAYAGCPSMLMSHWVVDDEASSQIMSYFYENLSEGLPKDEALHQAKLVFLEKTTVPKTHPFFWSNFVMIGDTSPIVEPSISFSYIFLTLAILAFIVILFRNSKKTFR